jgi:predicted ester cyclase
MIRARERTPVLAFKFGIAAHNMNAQGCSVRSSETTNGRWISISRQETEFVPRHPGLFLAHVSIAIGGFATETRKDIRMSKAEDNKAIVSRWFTEFWGKTCNLGVVDELAASDMLLQYSLHEPRRGRDDIKAFMTDFRRAFPDLNFWGTADLIAEGDYVVGQWEGGGTHTGPAFSDFLMGSLPPATGRKMHFTGTTVLRIQNGKITQDGKITQEIGLDDGVKALTQLGLIKAT